MSSFLVSRLQALCLRFRHNGSGDRLEFTGEGLIAIGKSFGDQVDTASLDKQVLRKKTIKQYRVQSGQSVVYTIQVLQELLRLLGFLVADEQWLEIESGVSRRARSASLEVVPMPSEGLRKWSKDAVAITPSGDDVETDVLAEVERMDRCDLELAFLKQKRELEHQTRVVEDLKKGAKVNAVGKAYWQGKAQGLKHELDFLKAEGKDRDLKRGAARRYLIVRGGMETAIMRNSGHASAMATSVMTKSLVAESTVYS